MKTWTNGDQLERDNPRGLGLLVKQLNFLWKVLALTSNMAHGLRKRPKFGDIVRVVNRREALEPEGGDTRARSPVRPMNSRACLPLNE